MFHVILLDKVKVYKVKSHSNHKGGGNDEPELLPTYKITLIECVPRNYLQVHVLCCH